MRNKITVLLLVLGLVLQSGATYAAPALTLNEATEILLENSDVLENLDDQVEEIEKQADRLQARGMSQRQLVEDFELYQKLDSFDRNGVRLTDDQEDELEKLRFMFMFIPFDPGKSGYIQMKLLGEYTYENVRHGANQLAHTRETTAIQLSRGLKGLYEGILSLENTLDLQRDYLDITERQAVNSKLKLSLGEVSILENEKAQMDYQAQIKQVENLERSLANLKMQLNEMLERDAQTAFSVRESIRTRSRELESLEYYLQSARETRYDYNDALRGLELAQIKYDVVSEVTSVETSDDFIDARITLLEAQDTLSTTLDALIQDVIFGYKEIKTALVALQNAEKTYVNAMESYRHAYVSYELGYMTRVQMDLATFQKDMADNALKEALRTYNATYDRFMDAVGVGPAFAEEGQGQ